MLHADPYAIGWLREDGRIYVHDRITGNGTVIARADRNDYADTTGIIIFGGPGTILRAR